MTPMTAAPESNPCFSLELALRIDSAGRKRLDPKLCESSYVRKILKRAKARYPNSFRTYRGCGLKFFVVS